MNSQDWRENEDRLEITSQDKAKHGHGKQADGSVLLKNTLSQSLEGIPRFAVPLLPVITVKSSGEERHVFSNAGPNMGLPANRYCMEEQKIQWWMNYVGVVNDGAVAGRSLVMFILETEGSIEEKELWEAKCRLKSSESWTAWKLSLSSCLCHRVPW